MVAFRRACVTSGLRRLLGLPRRRRDHFHRGRACRLRLQRGRPHGRGVGPIQGNDDAPSHDGGEPFATWDPPFSHRRAPSGDARQSRGLCQQRGRSGCCRSGGARAEGSPHRRPALRETGGRAGRSGRVDAPPPPPRMPNPLPGQCLPRRSSTFVPGPASFPADRHWRRFPSSTRSRCSKRSPSRSLSWSRLRSWCPSRSRCWSRLRSWCPSRSR